METYGQIVADKNGQLFFLIYIKIKKNLFETKKCLVEFFNSSLTAHKIFTLLANPKLLSSRLYIGATPCSPWNPSNKPLMVNQILETESQVPFHAMVIFYTNFGLLLQ